MNRFLRRFAWLLAAAGLWLLSAGGLEGGLGAWMIDRPQEERMKNVVLVSSSAQQPTGGTVPTTLPRLLSATREEAALSVLPETDEVLETAIEGGMRIKNETQYWVDAADILSGGLALTLPASEPQILIIHTHGSEAYVQSGADRYSASDDGRTEDTQFNVVRIGDELTEILTEAGLNVIHDRGIYDYPSYTGSYNRAGEAIEQYLESCPGIRVVLESTATLSAQTAWYTRPWPRRREPRQARSCSWSVRTRAGWSIRTGAAIWPSRCTCKTPPTAPTPRLCARSRWCRSVITSSSRPGR